MRTVYWLSQRAADVPAGSGWLSAAERSREAALRVPKRRADWRLGRWTAKRALVRLRARGGEEGGQSELARVEVRPTAAGVPEAFWDGEPAPWSLSISHSDGRSLVALGAAGRAVGCDIEAVASRSAAFQEESFSDAEREAIAASEAPEVLSTLFWSAKESLMKALGEGLRLPLQSLAIEPIGESRAASTWRTLQAVERRSGRRFLGYWRRDGGSVLTIVGEAAFDEPVGLS